MYSEQVKKSYTKFLYQGDLFYSKGHFADAFYAYWEAMDYCPDERECHKRITDTIYVCPHGKQIISPDGIITACEEIIDHNVKHLPAFYILNLYMNHDFSLLDFYEPLLTKYPGNEVILEGYADFYSRAGYDPEIAKANTGTFPKKKAEALFPQTSRSYMIRGKALTYAFLLADEKNMAEDAVRYLEKARKYDPNNKEAALYEGILFNVSGSHNLAAVVLKCYYASTKDERLLIPLGVTLFCSGDVIGGLECFAKAKIDPNENFDGYDRLLKACIARNCKRAEELMRDQLRLFPKRISGIKKVLAKCSKDQLDGVIDQIGNYML